MGNRTAGRRLALVSVVAAVVLAVVLAWIGRESILFALDFERIGRNAQGYDEYRHRQTGIVFVSLPGGTFRMGSPEDDTERQTHEVPVHEVALSPFLIAKYEVTQREWESVMGSNPSKLRGDDRPVETVSWEECREFCAKTGLRLPSEAQWEYACRAGASGGPAGDAELDELGWYERNSAGTTHPVGQKLPNGFGLHDVHGNVWEWCADWYQDDFYEESAGATDPLCRDASSGLRVQRGGGWLNDAANCRSAFRHWYNPGARTLNVGLRPVVRRS